MAIYLIHVHFHIMSLLEEQNYESVKCYVQALSPWLRLGIDGLILV